MKTYFAEVLARESACLSAITDTAMLTQWRLSVVDEVMTPHSPYALALQSRDDARCRAEFLNRWAALLAETVARLRRSTGEVDPQTTAIAILSALHGGSMLSRLTRDPRPLTAALDVALVPLSNMDT